MSSKNIFLNIFLVIIGAASLSYVTINNLTQLKEYSTQIEDTSTLLNTRRGKQPITNEPANTKHTPETYCPIDKTTSKIQSMKDPFAEIETLPDFKLTGITHNNNRLYAVINDQIVTSGEYIENFKILEVTDDFVKLSDGKHTITLNLYLPTLEDAPPPP